MSLNEQTLSYISKSTLLTSPKAVGYGNQAPGEYASACRCSGWRMILGAYQEPTFSTSSKVTGGGRTLVACLAWISIIIWGLILYVSGQVVSIIMDDLFRKCHLRFMTRDIFATIFWGVLALIWIVIMSELGFLWWNMRLSAVDDLGRADSMWWAYISILTV